MDFPLVFTPIEDAPQASLGLSASSLEPLYAAIQGHIEEGRYPGCQLALAWQGRLLVDRSFGMARLGKRESLEPNAQPVSPDPNLDDQAVVARPDHLWLLYSNTKVLIAAALWKLAENGQLRFGDPVSAYLPSFSRHGKGGITLYHLITHQAGFPHAEVPASMWHDMSQVAEFYADVVPEWVAGSRVHYHGLSAHWVLALVMEAVTGQRFQDAVRRLVLEPLGLAQDLLMGGRLNGVQWISPRTLAYAIRNHTGDRVDQFMGIPMHRGLGPHMRGHSLSIRGLGDIAPADTFGHGGVGTSYCWGDPQSGLSMAYITNARIPEPWHSWRLNQISNLVHAAIRPLG
ncbi:MAG: class A beta-lactamase-related serine hydrolase [Betaproteobacteria bacterium]|nr:class A beta-lactamase-related serine hydrolase [Betaproteobacteria bacterium]